MSHGDGGADGWCVRGNCTCGTPGASRGSEAPNVPHHARVRFRADGRTHLLKGAPLPLRSGNAVVHTLVADTTHVYASAVVVLPAVVTHIARGARHAPLSPSLTVGVGVPTTGDEVVHAEATVRAGAKIRGLATEAGLASYVGVPCQPVARAREPDGAHTLAHLLSRARAVVRASDAVVLAVVPGVTHIRL